MGDGRASAVSLDAREDAGEGRFETTRVDSAGGGEFLGGGEEDGGRDARASRESGGSAGRTGGEVRYESSSSISISEKSSESCDVSADMVTLRLPNERIVERSCEASRSGRRGARSRTGVARTGRRALSCGSSGGRVETESAGVAATSNGARVCARAGRHARWFKISGKQSSFYLLLSDSKNARRSNVFPVTNFAKYQYVTASERGRSLMDFENEPRAHRRGEGMTGFEK